MILSTDAHLVMLVILTTKCTNCTGEAHTSCKPKPGLVFVLAQCLCARKLA